MTQVEKQGAWVDCGRDNDYNKYYRCPHCDHEIIMYQGCRRTFPNFCEECGFDMKTQEKTDNQMKELKPCPFCGGDAYEESYDRLIQIGCRKCNYHMSFDGVLQTKINTGVVGSYTLRSDGVKIPYEYYDAKAHEKAYAVWNKRCYE